MPPHYGYLWWVVYVADCVGGWKYLPLLVVRLVAAFTRDETRARQCLEVIRLSRRDASDIPTYLTNSSTPTGAPAPAHSISTEPSGQTRTIVSSSRS